MRLSAMKTFLVLSLATLLLFSIGSMAQELFAGLDGYVKDPTGAVIAKATVEVTGTKLIGTKKMQTSAAGYFRFENLPPGVYRVVVTAPGFSTERQENIELVVGRFPTLDIKLQIGKTSETVEVTGAAPLVDTTQSKSQTVASQAVLEGIPTGRSYQSVIGMAPGARYEPLQTSTSQGFQIDGASNSENSYLVEGQETANLRQGTSNTNVPMEFIQEVQVKSGGFEAQYGGALGGVVNVIQKRGSNTWHGSIFTSYRGDAFDAAPDQALRRVPNTVTNAGGAKRLDQPVEYFQAKKDHYRVWYPGFEVGGYLAKNRLWTFLSTVPQLESDARTVNMNFAAAPGVSPTVGLRTFKSNYQTYYSLARVDFMASQKVRLYGAWQYNYQRASGTAIPAADSPYYTSGNTYQYNASAVQDPNNFFNGIGNTQPNKLYNVGADITINPHMIATTRYGYAMQDFVDVGKPTSGVRFLYADSNYNYPSTTPLVVDKTQDITGAFIAPAGSTNAQLAGPGGFQTLPNNLTQFSDRLVRHSFQQDFSWYFKGAGSHNVKFGYGFNRYSESPLAKFTDSLVLIAWGQQYYNLEVNQARCDAIIAQNVTNFGEGAAAAGCTGKYGTFNIHDGVEMDIPVSSLNHSLYVQDAWTVGHNLTLNVGVRFDKEHLPPFNAASGQGFKGIDFGFGQKFAPRLGFAWDPTGKGKLKLAASYGWFYDIMKYEMPRGSFGGEYWHDCVYTLDTTNYKAIVPSRDSGGHLCPLDANAGNGAIPLSVGRFIENQDFRAPSNDPNNYLVDPNLKPMRVDGLDFSVNWEMKKNLAFEGRYTRKRLVRTIEDSGIQTPMGEQFYIVNPGEGINKQIAASDCPDCPANPKPMRRYDAMELRLTRLPSSSNWFGSVSYIYSALRGNWTGLTSSDQSDGVGRNDPNVSRAFDEPNMQFDAHGKVIDGPLATDRPHTFKAQGYYRLKWFGQETTFGIFQYLYSGTPITSYMSVFGAPQFVEGRGKFVELVRDPVTGVITSSGVKELRTPKFSQTDFHFGHEFKVSKQYEGMKLGFEATFSNLFNQHSVVNIAGNIIRTGNIKPLLNPIPSGSQSGLDYKAAMTGFNYIDALNHIGTTGSSTTATLSSLYGMPNLFQDQRTMRFKIKFTF